MGRLDVRICEARNLPDTQLLSKPDPYVVVQLEHQRHKTSVCKNQTSPHWDEVMKFTVGDEHSAQLKIELWNENVVSDEFLGQYSLSLNGLTRGVADDQWYLLQQCKTNAELHIRLLAVDFGHDPPSQAQPDNPEAANPAPKPAQPQHTYPPAPQPSYPAPPAAVGPPQPIYAMPPQQPHPVAYGAPPQPAPPQPMYAVPQQPPAPYGVPPLPAYPAHPGYPPQQQPPYPPQQPPYPPQQPPYPPQQQPPGWPPRGF